MRFSFPPVLPSCSNSPKWLTQRERGEAPYICLLVLLESMKLSIHSRVWLCMKFKVDFSIAVMNISGILMGIALNM
jgi:hypothetical protein